MERATTIGRSHDLLIVLLLLFAQSQRISFAAGSYGFMSSVSIQRQPKFRDIFGLETGTVTGTASLVHLEPQAGEGGTDRKISGRGDRIRTCDIYVPNVALYQSELHPDTPWTTRRGRNRIRSRASFILYCGTPA